MLLPLDAYSIHNKETEVDQEGVVPLNEIPPISQIDTYQSAASKNNIFMLIKP